MPDLLHFEAILQSKDDRPQHVVVFFAGLDPITAAQVAEALQVHLPKYVLPDHVVFLLPEIYRGQIKAESRKKNSALSTALERKPQRLTPSYGFAFFDAFGAITHYLPVDAKHEHVKALVLGKQKILAAAGMQRIVSKTDVLPKAPAGYLFYKPSARSSNYFIRGENLLSETSHAHFLAFATLFLFKEAESDGKGQVETLYMDTMALLPVALSLQMFRKLFGFNIPLRIESFHSHEGLKNGSLPFASTALCLISASSSCGLAKLWRKVNGAPEGRVLTFLSFSNKSSNCFVLHQINKPKDFRSVGENDSLQARKMIRMHGERFVAEHSATKILNIGKVHLPADLQMRFDGFVGQGFFSCFNGKGLTGKRRTVNVDKDMLVGSAQFMQWFDTCLKEELPASTSCIIHDDDSASQLLANHAHDYIVSRGITKCQLVGMNDFDDSQSFEGSAIIIAAAAERGTKLLSISRRLRRVQSHGTRLYIIGALFGRTYGQMKELSSNLTQPAYGCRHYSFRTYLDIPAASEPCIKHWSDELHLLSSLAVFSDDGGPKEIRDRIEVLNELPTSGLEGHAFWPSSQTGKAMKLSPGFAFVEDKANVQTATEADVFLTILWVLQTARESLKIDEEKRLSSGELQQVLLSPEIFSRYDDGIIQAAFLRAALPTELDYSAHEIHSLSMADIISRAVLAYGSERGEAAMEFLLAIAIGKIQLAPDVFESLKLKLVQGMAMRLPWIEQLFDQGGSL